MVLQLLPQGHTCAPHPIKVPGPLVGIPTVYRDARENEGTRRIVVLPENEIQGTIEVYPRIKEYNEPLAAEILRHHGAPTFKFPKMLYDGLGDPKDHLADYTNHVNILVTSDEVRYKAFLMNLEGLAHAWYLALLRHFTSNFEQLADLFMRRFLDNKTLQ
ncbi:hypothetical protein PVK06_047291 [Gossypium arboreum]|uniref:Retrotransposon gag domain-containing protein n=1 Tax=Gossypium arboreum TaxID=29729 RepID=A0ABR0MD87_GOSAR|nr:hypothetical protein PVK06_047291 [Gossypium arboreum]